MLWHYRHNSVSMVVSETLQWRHNERDRVSNHQPHDCLFNCLFRRSSKKTSKLRVTGLCAGKSSGTGEFPAQSISNEENVSIWWRHRGNGALAVITIHFYPTPLPVPKLWKGDKLCLSSNIILNGVSYSIGTHLQCCWEQLAELSWCL